MAVTSKELLEKSLQAALSAIELYNKPDFRYREETFAVLMCTAWELLLKAKVLYDGGEEFSLIVVTRPETDSESGVTKHVPKTNRSGNPMTVGLGALAARTLESKVDGYSKECLTNTQLLIELRDNAVHLVNADLALSERVLAIGSASLKNYMSLASRWFSVDFSRYNFYLMPMSFYHGFETIPARSIAPANEQSRRFLEYLATIESQVEEGSEHHVLLSIETKVVKGKGGDGLPVRWTTDASAPAISVREESLLETYPYDNADLVKKLRDRYTDFKQGAEYQKYKKPLEDDRKYCRRRLYNPKRPGSGSKNFFSPEVFKVFDKHYTKK
jgi:Protein of unknown function (DUF3644)